MSESEATEPVPGPSRSLADLVVPRRPAGVPYAEGDDYDAAALLQANDIGQEPAELIAVLDDDLSILQAAAARTLGVKGTRMAIKPLRQLAGDTSAEETARVQAALALARLGEDDGHGVLVQMLSLSPEASPAPLQAAGALAQLNDPRGFPLVTTSLNSANPVTAMVATRQLIHFAGLDGSTLAEGGTVDLFGAYRQALARPERRIVGEARAQLVALDSDQARALMKAGEEKLTDE